MKKLSMLPLLFVLGVSQVWAGNGLVVVESAHDVKTTADKLEAALKAKGMTVFMRINHADNASKAGLTMHATELVVFGNPKIGTPLMNCSASVAIDLPQKMLIRKDESGQVLLSYNAPDYLVSRHKIVGCEKVLEKVKGALAKFASAATMP
ncbi:MAG: DUF302 domain-containing protein [Gammaproteobacteria bacterium]|nr:MAG: DUF302 domain-containing protein [Gammaproteobacteria bacterium]